MFPIVMHASWWGTRQDATFRSTVTCSTSTSLRNEAKVLEGHLNHCSQRQTRRALQQQHASKEEENSDEEDRARVSNPRSRPFMEPSTTLSSSASLRRPFQRKLLLNQSQNPSPNLSSKLNPQKSLTFLRMLLLLLASGNSCYKTSSIDVRKRLRRRYCEI